MEKQPIQTKSASNLVERLTRDNVKRMAPYTSARDEFKDHDLEMVFLDANESPFSSEVNRYPDPHQRHLKKEVARIKGVMADNILIGNGSDEVLDLLFRAFCEPGKDEVVIVSPTYGMYEVLANLNNISCKEVVMRSGFQPDAGDILQATGERTKMIFLCSPNNPTGNTIPSAVIEELLSEFNGLVVLDEAYIDFSETEGWLPQLSCYPNLVVSQTLSKAWGMAGLRLGLLFAHPELIAILKKIKPPYNVNSLSIAYAVNRLKSHEGIEDEIRLLKNERDKLFTFLPSLTFVKEVFPSEANFILVRVDDAGLRYKQLVDFGIVVRNRSNQPLCENCLRFTVGTPKENEMLIETLKILS